MKLCFLNLFLGLIINHLAFCQTNIVTLSEKIGTEIDIHENRFYRIFPDEKGFISAQIIDVGQDNFRINIVKDIDGKKMKVRRYRTKEDIKIMQNKINELPPFTKKSHRHRHRHCLCQLQEPHH